MSDTILINLTTGLEDPERVTVASLGVAFAHAIAGRDLAKLAELLHPEVEFRALTPRRSWESVTRAGSLDVLRTWFGDCHLEVVRVDTAEIAGRHHVAYRYEAERPDGSFLIEQQAYYDVADGRITWIRLLCSGFRSRALVAPELSPIASEATA